MESAYDLPLSSFRININFVLWQMPTHNFNNIWNVPTWLERQWILSDGWIRLLVDEALQTWDEENGKGLTIGLMKNVFGKTWPSSTQCLRSLLKNNFSEIPRGLGPSHFFCNLFCVLIKGKLAGESCVHLGLLRVARRTLYFCLHLLFPHTINHLLF